MVHGTIAIVNAAEIAYVVVAPRGAMAASVLSALVAQDRYKRVVAVKRAIGGARFFPVS